MPDLKMLNLTKYLYKLTFIKYSYEPPAVNLHSPYAAREYCVKTQSICLIQP